MHSVGVQIPNAKEHERAIAALRAALGAECPRMEVNTEYKEMPSGESVTMIVMKSADEIERLANLIEKSQDAERLFDRVRLLSFYAANDLSSPFLILNERTKLNHPLIKLDERQTELETAARQMDIPGMTVGLRSDLRTIVVDFPDESAVHTFSKRPQPAALIGTPRQITVNHSLLAIT